MTSQVKRLPISDEAMKEMSQTILDNWKGGSLENLHKRSNEITKEISYLDSRQRLLKEEMKVIWYFIAKREAENH